jgi:hypothetical protein
MLSILIVTFNNERHIESCLESLPWDRAVLDVWIADNRSSDGTRDKIESFIRSRGAGGIRMLANGRNLGYAEAVNRALAVCRGQWICLLGPDTAVRPFAFERMIGYLKNHPDTGAVAPRLVDASGRTQASCRRFPTLRDALFEMTGLPRLFPKRFIPRWKMPDFPHDAIREVEQPEATCLMIRRSILERVGGLDGRFPLFFNDVDWCRRIRMAGSKIAFLPDAVVAHVRGASVDRAPVVKIWKSHQGFYRYFQKYATRFPDRIANQALGCLLVLTAVLRTAWCVVRPRKGKSHDQEH